MADRRRTDPELTLRIQEYHRQHPRASRREIAASMGLVRATVDRALVQPRTLRAPLIRKLAREGLTESQIAHQLGCDRGVVTQTLKLKSTTELHAENRQKPRGLPPLCRHDRARNERQISMVVNCCLKEPPTMYVAPVLPITENLYVGYCPQLGIRCRATSKEEMAQMLRREVDVTIGLAIANRLWLPMPIPTEADRPSEIWGITVDAERMWSLFERWRGVGLGQPPRRIV